VQLDGNESAQGVFFSGATRSGKTKRVDQNNQKERSKTTNKEDWR